MRPGDAGTAAVGMAEDEPLAAATAPMETAATETHAAAELESQQLPVQQQDTRPNDAVATAPQAAGVKPSLCDTLRKRVSCADVDDEVCVCSLRLGDVRRARASQAS